MSDYKQAFEVESRKTGAQQIVIGEQREDIERLTASNEANADHARLANHNQDLLRAANKRLQARVEELEADAETHDAQLTKVARLRLDLESENIRLQARVDALTKGNRIEHDAAVKFENYSNELAVECQRLQARVEALEAEDARLTMMLNEYVRLDNAGKIPLEPVGGAATEQEVSDE